MTCAASLAHAREQLLAAIAVEREKGHTMSVGSVEYVLAKSKHKYVLLDYSTMENGTVAEFGEDRLPVDNVKPILDETFFIKARAEPYHEGDPESYLHARGGEPIVFRLGSFTERGWVAATFVEQESWRWLPLCKCAC